MSYKYYFGPSGYGKTYKMHQDIIKASLSEPERNILVITPDQYTMQTQRDIVLSHPSKGMMNIEVASFSRLAGTVFEEVGLVRRIILDDTGKNLMLRKLSLDMKDELTSLGSNLDKTGFIHEIKSVISEFMQYGIAVKDVDVLIDKAKDKKALVGRLTDLKKLYSAFMETLSEKYETKEERLTLLAGLIPKSEFLKDSLVVFDGFTGFTPVQGQVISAILKSAKEVWFSMTVTREEVVRANAENSLFSLSLNSIEYIDRLAKEAGINKGQDVYLDDNKDNRLAGNDELSFLEKHLFRNAKNITFNDNNSGANKTNNISINVFSDPRQELENVAASIRQFIEKGNRYQDVAIITGDLERYASYVPEIFEGKGIPYFIDSSKKLVMNPFTEYVRSGFDIIANDFSYDALIHFLRSGLTGIDNKDIDAIDNYILARGIRGASRWTKEFLSPAKYMKELVDGKAVITEKTKEELAKINEIRVIIMGILEPLLEIKANKEYEAIFICKQLYKFIDDNGIAEKLTDYADRFDKAGDLVRSNEYGQVYRKVMEVLEQIAELIGHDKLDADEFVRILEAGIGEIKIGVLPPGMDYVPIGDIERARLKNIKKLYFIGVNDGVIPKSGVKGGLISDLDRDFFERNEENIKLAPSPRQKMTFQKMYLYMNMTKPTEELFVSYTKKDAEGKSILPSYLIQEITKLFPNITKRYSRDIDEFNNIYSINDCSRTLSNSIRETVNNGYSDDDNALKMAALLKVLKNSNEECADRIIAVAFEHYDSDKVKILGHELVKALYGAVIRNSISRLENFAGCAYRHFLNYGMSLKEKEEASFGRVDIGNVIHEVLKEFHYMLKETNTSWRDISEEQVTEYVRESLSGKLLGYGDGILNDSYRDAYQFKRLERILTRTIMNMGYHLRKGMFNPKKVEVEFAGEITGSFQDEDEKTFIRGQIDRVDTYEDDDKVYVKIVDYKSGKKSLDLIKLYEGKQLQLMVYLDQACKAEKRENENKTIVPTAVFYYRVHDPLISSDTALSDEELGNKINEELKDSGIYIDNLSAVELLDREITDKGNVALSSDVINAVVKKDGDVSLYKGDYVSQEDMNTLIDYTNYKVSSLASKMKRGDISPDSSDEDQCSYCAYQDICNGGNAGDKDLTDSVNKNNVMEKMREAILPNGR